MVYGTDNNFLGANIYNSFRKALAHEITEKKLILANKELQRIKPNWKFKIYDALRPHRYQVIFWEKVSGTSQEAYVMNPRYGSIHSYGFALDLTLEDDKGIEIDMGTPVDTLDRLSEPRLEEHFLKTKQLTQQQVDNRKILRQVMAAGGFIGISNEWWHYEALPGHEVRAKYPIYK
jgi:D-alanyl-D-alanine dipeptidase